MSTQTFLDSTGATKHRQGLGTGADSSNGFTCSFTGLDAHDAAASALPIMGGGYASAAAPTDVSADGDAVRAWFLKNGSQVVNLAIGGTLVTTLPVSLASATVASGAIASGAIASGAIAAGAIAAGATSIAANQDDASGATDRGIKLLAKQTATPANLAGSDGDWEGLQMSGGCLWVNAKIAASQTLATVSTVTTVTTLTGSGVAHDAADSGNPHKIGAKATSSLSGLTLVADADRTDLRGGLDGVLINRPHTNLEDQVQEIKTNTDGASTAMTGGFAAPGAGIRLWLTSLIISNSSATNITVDIRDGSAGSVLATFPVPANSGCIFNPPVPLKFTANTAAAFDGSAAATTLSVTMIGFKSKI